ncbi:NAD(P)-binding protein [Daldinia caldariorum]|uniref:NAD(P)-binding protein n=1 Tax=Daldinia caldariorum TaxID=326644 RepID=UPI002008D85B|nr:NAD(P)-binding protein [Daldinia caldariorum]KAI1466503.1 NAD(P)-binding protein [Daldinia caldariorum]
MPQNIVLISGANRGLGEGLAKRFLAKPNHTVVAANRDPSHPTSRALADLPRAEGSRLVVVKVDATVERDAFDAVDTLREEHGIDHLDIVIANAGVSFVWPAVKDVKIDDIRAHVEPNVYGVVALYQATRPLLQLSQREPIFTPIGSSAGFIGKQLPIPNAAYGPSKAALHWFTVRINAEDDWLNAFVMVPGWVQTELGNAGARQFGVGQAPLGVDESCDGMVQILAVSTKEKHGGKAVSYDGEITSEW